MTGTRVRRQRVALIDLQLADCDRLAANLGNRLQVSLVIAPSENSPLARWAELGGYPWATDLEALTAVVADTVAVAAESPRRADALALAGALGARGALFGAIDQAARVDEIASREAEQGLEEALAELFETEKPESPASDPWSVARNAGFCAGAVFELSDAKNGPQVLRRFGEPDAFELLTLLTREAHRSPHGWAALAMAERGFWKAWCAYAPGRGDTRAVALGGRLLPAQGYGLPMEDAPQQQADRDVAEELLRYDWARATKRSR